MRVFVAIPSVLDSNVTAAMNILHFNWSPDSAAAGEWTSEELVAQDVDVKGVNCNIYSRTYTSAVAPDAATKTPAYIGFYMDRGVDMNDEGQYTITRNGKTEVINYNFAEGVTIPVFAQGIQADGFDSAEAAFADSGLPTNPWAE